MRNLSLIDCLRVGDAVELEGTEFLCVDYDTKEVYCVSNKAIYVIKPETQDVSSFKLITEIFVSKCMDKIKNITSTTKKYKSKM